MLRNWAHGWLVACSGVLVAVAPAQDVVDRWQFTLRRPAPGWQQPGFDDGGWQQGAGGFGTRSTPGARVGTVRTQRHIWLRKRFEIPSIPARVALLLLGQAPVPPVASVGVPQVARTTAEYRARYVEWIRRLDELRKRGVAAAVYTQTTDVEGEINGLLTYDRKVLKIPAKDLRTISRVLFDD